MRDYGGTGSSLPLITGLIAAVADVLPVLGPGMVLAPVAIYQLLVGEYARALGILIGWLVIVCIRQVVEPRLVSSTVKIHPLASLAAIYFSLVARNLWVLFYVLGLCSLYAAFRETGALPPLSEPPPEKASINRKCPRLKKASPRKPERPFSVVSGLYPAQVRHLIFKGDGTLEHIAGLDQALVLAHQAVLMLDRQDVVITHQAQLADKSFQNSSSWP